MRLTACSRVHPQGVGKDMRLNPPAHSGHPLRPTSVSTWSKACEVEKRLGCAKQARSTLQRLKRHYYFSCQPRHEHAAPTLHPRYSDSSKTRQQSTARSTLQPRYNDSSKARHRARYTHATTTAATHGTGHAAITLQRQQQNMAAKHSTTGSTKHVTTTLQRQQQSTARSTLHTRYNDSRKTRHEARYNDNSSALA
jgi:hypothetical protein